MDLEDLNLENLVSSPELLNYIIEVCSFEIVQFEVNERDCSLGREWGSDTIDRLLYVDDNELLAATADIVDLNLTELEELEQLNEESVKNENISTGTSSDISDGKKELIEPIDNNNGDSGQEKPNLTSSIDNELTLRLFKHLKANSITKIFKCSECNFAATRKNNLFRHQQIHRSEKCFKCFQCNYATIRRDRLVTHLKIHTGERSYKCNLCDYSAIRRDSLDYHLKSHAGEKPHKCPKCKFGTARKNVLARHLLIHAEEDLYRCEHCDYQTITKYHLTLHLKAHDRDPTFKCDECGYETIRKSNLGRHLSRHAKRRKKIEEQQKRSAILDGQ